MMVRVVWKCGTKSGGDRSVVVECWWKGGGPNDDGDSGTEMG